MLLYIARAGYTDRNNRILTSCPGLRSALSEVIRCPSLLPVPARHERQQNYHAGSSYFQKGESYMDQSMKRTTDRLTALPSIDEQVFRYSKIYQQRRRPISPNQELGSALRAVGYRHALPLEPVNDKNFTSMVSENMFLQALHSTPISNPMNKSQAQAKPGKLHLQSILANYISFFHSAEAKRAIAENPEQIYLALERIFDAKSIGRLNSDGHEVEDVVSWAWIITAKTSEQAATRLLRVCNAPTELKRTNVPYFVLHFLLARHEISRSALRLLIIHAKDRLDNRHNVAWESQIGNQLVRPESAEKDLKEMAKYDDESIVLPYYRKMKETSVAHMIFHLSRHARRILPQSLPTIATLFTEHVKGESTDENGLRLSVTADISKIYNDFLSLLALPSSRSPFQSILYHQQAQFTVLRKMAKFNPALAVNREGYRGVIGVQLAHRKTFLEREWAAMKASSWPPWKTDKLGLDTQKGLEFGISRAKEALSKLSASGYASYSWEDSASILSGWDTDNSPTIQTRRVLKVPKDCDREEVTDSGEANIGLVWAARIRATRNLDEAWACFLTYKDKKLPALPEVYHAMFEKLTYEDVRQSQNEKKPFGLREASVNAESAEYHVTEVSTGDGLEVLEPPKDPRKRVYVPVPPPSVQSFFSIAIEDGIMPAGRLLAFLLLHADSFKTFVRYMEHSDWPLPLVRIFSGKAAVDPGLLKMVPRNEFNAAIQQLSRPASRLPLTISLLSKRSIPPTSANGTQKNPLVHAFRLVLNCKPRYAKAWNILLSAILRQSTTLEGCGPGNNALLQDIGKWSLANQLFEEMRKVDVEPDVDTFRYLCQHYSAAVVANYKAPITDGTRPSEKVENDPNAEKYKMAPEISNVDLDQDSYTVENQMVEAGLVKLKKIFSRLTASEFALKDHLPTHQPLDDPGAILTRLLYDVPGPVYLHSFITALGVAQDHRGIRDVVAWMARFASELNAVVAEQANGFKQLRRCLISARAFLDGDWDEAVPHPRMQPASEKLLREVRDIIEDIEEWGAWPCDQEVQLYCRIYVNEHRQ